MSFNDVWEALESYNRVVNGMIKRKDQLKMNPNFIEFKNEALNDKVITIKR